MNSEPMELVYQAPPEVAGWFRWIIGGVVGFTLVLAVIFLAIDVMAALIFFGVTLFDGLLFWSVVPRRFEIYSNGLKIQLGGPLASFTRLENIRNARLADSSSAVAYHGIKFATTTHGVVEITRSKGLDMVITPADPLTFLEQLEQVRRQQPAASQRI